MSCGGRDAISVRQSIVAVLEVIHTERMSKDSVRLISKKHSRCSIDIYKQVLLPVSGYRHEFRDQAGDQVRLEYIGERDPCEEAL